MTRRLRGRVAGDRLTAALRAAPRHALAVGLHTDGHPARESRLAVYGLLRERGRNLFRGPHMDTLSDDPELLARLEVLAGELAERHREACLVVNRPDPKADAPSRVPYCTLISQSNAFERANCHARVEPPAIRQGGCRAASDTAV